jgi:hypothetical protein
MVGIMDCARARTRCRSSLRVAGRDELLSLLADEVLEATIPERFKTATSSLAVDWTDHESFSRATRSGEGPRSDLEATFGRRHGRAPGVKNEIFLGYYGQVATMVRENGAAVIPELVRRVELTPCSLDPPGAMVTVLSRMVKSGVPLGDVLVDSGYSIRKPERFALPLRVLGASLVIDLHPEDRGEKGTHGGAVLCNGNLYCPATPPALFQIAPLPKGASDTDIASHDERCAELARYKLGVVSSNDSDGHHRVGCPAVLGKLRCPLRPGSLSLSHSRPTVLSPPEGELPTCCTQQTITVPPSVNAKTRQRHDYPSPAHRSSYGRRTASERSFATAKDPAGTGMRRGWCRLMGRAKNKVMYALAFVADNLALLAAFEAKEKDSEHRAAAGLPPRARRRRRKTLAEIAGTDDEQKTAVATTG